MSSNPVDLNGLDSIEVLIVIILPSCSAYFTSDLILLVIITSDPFTFT